MAVAPIAQAYIEGSVTRSVDIAVVVLTSVVDTVVVGVVIVVDKLGVAAVVMVRVVELVDVTVTVLVEVTVVVTVLLMYELTQVVFVVVVEVLPFTIVKMVGYPKSSRPPPAITVRNRLYSLTSVSGAADIRKVIVVLALGTTVTLPLLYGSIV
jgi:hypothetical protein